MKLTWSVTREVINDCKMFLFSFSFRYVINVSQLNHWNKHSLVVFLSTLTIYCDGVNRKMKEKLIESSSIY